MNNQQFTIASTEPNIGVESWNDLTELFQDDFFPNEMDFTNIFSENNDFNMLSEKNPFASTATTTSVPASSTSPMECNDEGSDNDEQLTSAQQLDRRNRNREHAKRSRLRKRVLLDTLQDQLSQLHAQNLALRRVVSERLPSEISSQVLLQCTTTESTLLNNDVQALPSMLTSRLQDNKQGSNGEGSSDAQKALMEPDYRLMQSLITSQQNFVLSDPKLPDNPIIYASEGFCRLSGYSRQEVLGRNCRFLQGPKTDPAAVALVRQALVEGEDVSVCLLNYRKDGSTFWNQFFLGALKDSQGKIVNYVGVQCEVNMQPVSGIKDRVKKLPLPGV